MCLGVKASLTIVHIKANQGRYEHFLSTQNIADAEEEKALAERGAPTPCTTSRCVFPAKAACILGAVAVVTVNVALCSRGPS